MEKVNTLKSAVQVFATWALLALMFSDSYLAALIFGFGGLLLWASTHAERREDLLFRAGGFFVMALAVLLVGGSWPARFLMLSLAGIGIAYVLAYLSFKLTGSDFLERYFLAFAGFVVFQALMITYPHPTRAVLALFYLLVAGSVVYLLYLAITYVSVRLKNADVDPLPPMEYLPKGDAYSKDLARVVRAFVEKGDKTPLLVFVLRHSPRGILDVHLERAVKPIVEYRPAIPPLTPPWLMEKRMAEEASRRRKLVEDLLRFIESAGGVE